MKMNCMACSNLIDKNRGYYLVSGAPYCVECYQAPDGALDIWKRPPKQDPEDLLDAFREYQKRSQASACQSF